MVSLGEKSFHLKTLQVIGIGRYTFWSGHFQYAHCYIRISWLFALTRHIARHIPVLPVTSTKLVPTWSEMNAILGEMISRTGGIYTGQILSFGSAYWRRTRGPSSCLTHGALRIKASDASSGARCARWIRKFRILSKRVRAKVNLPNWNVPVQWTESITALYIRVPYIALYIALYVTTVSIPTNGLHLLIIERKKNLIQTLKFLKKGKCLDSKH